MGCCSCACCSCGCSVLCSKAFLILFNSIFLLTGGGILGLGLWLHFDKEMVTYIHVIQSNPQGLTFQTVAYILMGVGGFVLLVGFLGCCGACCESICMLCVYSLLVFLVLLAEITAAALIYKYREKIDHYVSTTLQEQVKYKYNRSNSRENRSDVITIAWDYMQVNLNCCGSIGPSDYKESLWQNTTKDEGVFVPATCCYMTNEDARYPQVADVGGCQIEALLFPGSSDRYALKRRGCYNALQEWLEENMTLIIALSSSIVGLQVFGLILACCLLFAIRRMEKDTTWYDDDDI